MKFTRCLEIIVLLCIIAVSETTVPDMTAYQKEMTPNLYVSFENDTKEFKPSSVEEIMNASRSRFLSIFYATDYGTHDERLMGCYLNTITFRSAIWDLKRYFDIRYLYVNTLEFEVGYLTYEIIHRYQLILELLWMVRKRYLKNRYRNYVTSTSFMLYIYANIIIHTKAIIHLCNMLHEVEKKYKLSPKKSVFDDYILLDPSNKDPFNKTAGLTEEELHMLWLEKKRKQEKKKAKQRKKMYKEMMKFGFTTSRKPTSPKKGPFPLVYGWSIENWEP